MKIEVLGSFCNFICEGQRRDIPAKRRGETGLQDGIGLQGFQLLEATMEGALDAGVVTSEAVELILQIVIGQQFLVRGAGTQFNLHAANTVKVPRGGDELIKQGLLDAALRLDIGLAMGEQLLEFFVFAWGDDNFAGGEAVLRSILRRAVFSFDGSWSGGMLGVGGVGREPGGGSGHNWNLRH